MDAATDAELIRKVRRGDREAYGVLVRRHTSLALRTAALLGAGDEMEDVVQDSFVKAYGALDRFRDDAPFRPWLLKIVANETRNLHRARGRRTARERIPLSEAESPDPVERVLAREDQRALHRRLARLSPEHRSVLVCRYLLDLDERETAVVLGVAPGTVKSRSHRALNRLRADLAETGSEVGHA